MTSFEGHKSRETGYLLCAGGESKPSVFLLLETFFAKSRGDVFGRVCLCACLGVRLPSSVLLPQPLSRVE